MLVRGVESAHLDDGPALSEVEVDEARCGASTRDVVSRPVPGRPGKLALLGVGRRKRAPNKALVRALFVRDRCCQMPGCGRTRHLHAHHVVFWSAGGRTDPDNLILLCGSCHRSLHRIGASLRSPRMVSSGSAFIVRTVRRSRWRHRRRNRRNGNQILVSAPTRRCRSAGVGWTWVTPPRCSTPCGNGRNATQLDRDQSSEPRRSYSSRSSSMSVRAISASRSRIRA